MKKRGRRRIRSAEYWRAYYTRKQREWRAAHPRARRVHGGKTKSNHCATTNGDGNGHGARERARGANPKGQLPP